jgi:dolichol-phosphate mannosyltransferase
MERAPSAGGPAGPQLAVVMPVHNEADTVRSVIEELHATIVGARDVTLFVFEDGSRDGTGDVLEAIAASMPALRISTSRERKGYPRAVRDAILSIDPQRFPLLLFLDGDGQYDPREFKRLLAEFRAGRVDIVNGHRRRRTEPLYRSLPSKLLRRLETLLFNPGCKDVTSAFRLMRTSVAQAVAREVRYSRYNFWLEFTARARSMGYRQVEVPVSYRARAGATKVYGLWKMPKILRAELAALLRTWLDYRRAEVVRFATVGLTGALVILGLLGALTELAGIPYLVSAAISIEVSIVWAFVLHEGWTFRSLRKSDAVLRRFGVYNLVALGGLTVNLVALFALTEALSIHYIVSEFLAIVVAFAFNYFASRRFAWTGHPRTASRQEDVRHAPRAVKEN